MYVTAVLVLSVAVSAPQLKDKPPKEPPIIGEWARVGHLQAGQPVGPDNPSHRQVFRADGGWEYYYGTGKTHSDGMGFTTDPRQSPANIDIYLNRSTGDGWRGIYKVEGDTLTVCLIRTPGERPKTFESAPDKPTTVWVFKRVTAKD